MSDDPARREPELLTITEAAELLRAPVATLRYWRHLGTGPRSFRLGRRVLYRSDDLRSWIDAQHDDQVCPAADARRGPSRPTPHTAVHRSCRGRPETRGSTAGCPPDERAGGGPPPARARPGLEERRVMADGVDRAEA
jgi:hypothetical protein